MGQTQHTVGTANVRACCILLLATGNVGEPGTGANIFRGHTNVQGATDLGLDIVTAAALLRPGRRRLEALVPRLGGRLRLAAVRSLRIDKADDGEAPGITVDALVRCGVLPKEQIDQDDNLQGDDRMGHGGNTITRMPEAVKGIEKLDLLVVVDPIPTTWRGAGESQGRHVSCCRSPRATRSDGSRTASNRSLQWGEQIVKPIFESKNDHEIMYLLAQKFGFADKMFKNIKVENNVPSAEDMLREINRGGWSTGYCGQSPERLKRTWRTRQDSTS